MALNESKLQFCSFRNWHSVQCCRKASVERDGKWFCKQHDPVAVQERRRLSEERWEAKNAEYIRASRLSRAAPELLEACQELLGLAEREGWIHVAINKARAAIAKAEGK